MQRLRKRINDRKILSLIWKCLRAGIMEQGSFRHSVLGTPQGGILTPPTRLQTFLFAAEISRMVIDPEDHMHLVVVHCHPLH
jgi:retron-type reverse transcriptase